MITTSYTGTGRVAGSDWGSPVFSENVLPNLSTADLTLRNMTTGVTVNTSSLTLS